MTALNPVIRIGDQIMEAFEAHGHLALAERAPARARSLRKWDCRSGADHQQLSASVVRRFSVSAP